MAGEGAHAPGDGIDGSVRRLPEEGEPELASKGGVREEGAAGRLLAMAWEMGDDPVRCGRSVEDGGARPACQREEDEGGVGWLAGSAKGRGPVVVWRRWPKKEGRESGPAGVEGVAGRGWAESGAEPEFKRNSFRISIYF
jgi:hypothetical protein